MHTFQTYPSSDMFEIDPFTKNRLRLDADYFGNKKEKGVDSKLWDSAFSGAKMLRLSLSVNPAIPKNLLMVKTFSMTTSSIRSTKMI